MLETASGCTVQTYKTVSGRTFWPNRDPIEYKGGINLYSYVKNNAVNAVDPQGLVVWDKLIGNVVGLVANTVVAAAGLVFSETGVGAVVAGYGAYGAAANLGNIVNDIRGTPEGPSGPIQLVADLASPDSKALDEGAHILDLAVPLVLSGGLTSPELVTEDSAKVGLALQALTTGALSLELVAAILTGVQAGDAALQGFDALDKIMERLRGDNQELPMACKKYAL